MAPAEPLIDVLVACSDGPRSVRLVPLKVPVGTTVAEALVQALGAAAPAGGGPVGIWGRKVPLDTPLREGDRVESYRGLKVDPKEARRVRYRTQGEKLPKGYHRPQKRTKDLTRSPGDATG